MFQCLLIEGENAGPEAKRNAEKYVITEEQFDAFLQRHSKVSQLVPESNTVMRDSYLILDEYVCAAMHYIVHYDNMDLYFISDEIS